MKMDTFMKNMTFVLMMIFSSSLFAISLKDGVYQGVDVKTNGKCKIEISYDGDYLTSRRAEYRMTVLSKGPRVDCSDYEGKTFDGCASGEHTNGDQSRSIYALLSSNGKIEKIYFQDSDFDSTNDRTCINFVLKKQ